MQRITLTIDDDQLVAIDQLCERRGYGSRSEAVCCDMPAATAATTHRSSNRVEDEEELPNRADPYAVHRFQTARMKPQVKMDKATNSSPEVRVHIKPVAREARSGHFLRVSPGVQERRIELRVSPQETP